MVSSWSAAKNYLRTRQLRDIRSHYARITLQVIYFSMSDIEMDGGVALAEQSHQLAAQTEAGAMDVESPPKAAVSITDSTLTSRRCVPLRMVNIHTTDQTTDQSP